jgi:hypothetical protein
MSELAHQLQQKIKALRKQIEDAEEIAALNLAKFRKAQQDLEEVEERSKLAENQLTFSSRCQCYKTFYGRKLQFFVIS